MTADTINTMWKISSGSRFVELTPAGLDGDPESLEAMREHAGTTVRLAPMSDTYTPTSNTDPVGVCLLARTVVPTPQKIEGTPPPVPAPQSAGPADAAY